MFANHAQAQAAQGPNHRLSERPCSSGSGVFPQDNSNTKKEDVSRTYEDYDGYAPIATYLGMEGWSLEVELRPGSQHSQNGRVGFINRVISGAKDLTKQPLLVRYRSRRV